MISSATIEDIIDKIQILSIVSPTWPEDLITNNLKFPNLEFLMLKISQNTKHR